MTDEASQYEELIHQVQLSLISGVGPQIRRRLLERFITPGQILRASITDLQTTQGVGPKVAKNIYYAKNRTQALEELQVSRENNITLITDTDSRYPHLLKEIHDPPGILFVKGELLPRDSIAVAVVGTRHASSYGLRQAERVAGSLARAGITVISGLARGIDAAAHRGAMAAGGRTIGVMASGVLKMYPPEHAKLADQICEQGCILSEAPPRMPPHSGAFPQRNRIVSGMSLGVVVVEAAYRSGALITARHAMEQNREVFAIPGSIESRLSQGPHSLIKDGAKLVQKIEDIMEELGALAVETKHQDGTTTRHPAELSLNKIEQQVLQAIETSPTLIDEVAEKSGLPIHRVLSTLSVLEMKLLIRRISGTHVARI